MASPYSPGVTDRTAADLAAKNSKAYFNKADWNRIYNNAFIVNTYMGAKFGIAIPFAIIASAAYSTTGTAANLNALLTNIRNLWLYPNLTLAGIVDVKTDWVGGVGSASPTYIDVNNWERDLDLLYAFSIDPLRRPQTGIATAGSGMTWQNRFRP